MNKIILSFLFVCYSACCFGETDISYPMEIKKIKSKNGVPLLFLPNYSNSIVTIKFVFQGAGSAYDGKNLAGISKAACLLLQDGAVLSNASKFLLEKEKNGIEINFDSGLDNISIILRSPFNKIDLAMSYLADLLYNKTVNDEDIGIAIDKLVSIDKMQREDANYIGNRKMYEVLHGDHYYNTDSYGNDSSRANINIESIRNFLKYAFTKVNLIVSASGNIIENDLCNLLDKYLNKLPMTQIKRVNIANANLKFNNINYHVEFDVPQTIVFFAQKGVKISNFPYLYIVFQEILSGLNSLDSLLSIALRDERGLVYSVGAQFINFQHSWFFMGNASTISPKELTDVIRSIWLDLQANGVTKSYLERAKNSLINKFILEMESGISVVNMLSYMQIFNIYFSDFDSYRENINKIDLPAINQFVSNLLEPEKLVFVTVGKKS